MSTTKTRTTVKKLTPGTKIAKVTLTPYQVNVLNVNKALKSECKSLGGARSVLMTFSEVIKLAPKFVKILKASKSKENYEILSGNVRTSKAGNYSPFYVLQSLHKNESKFLAEMKF